MRLSRPLLVLTLSAGFAAACGQPYSPQPPMSAPGVEGGAGVFGSSDQTTVYHTAPYAFLRSTLTDVLGVAPASPANAASPLADPVGYLDANQTLLGAPDYSTDASGTLATSEMSAGGFKVWIIAASSACGKMMQADPARLFPNGIDDVGPAFGLLLGRAPTKDELDILTALRADPAFTGSTPLQLDQKHGAAECTTILASLDFLTAN